MGDPRTALTPDEIRAAKLADWALLNHQLTARFRPQDFATGLELVNQIGTHAEQVDHHPQITLSYGDVVVALYSHDVNAITSRDIRSARAISDLAARLGISADVAGMTALDWALDTADADRLRPFYQALTGGEIKDGQLTDPSGQVASMWWQPSGDADDSTLPPNEVPQRWHVDAWVSEEEGPRRVQAVLDAGGTLISDDKAPSFWVVADADGNRHCICTSRDR